MGTAQIFAVELSVQEILILVRSFYQGLLLGELGVCTKCGTAVPCSGTTDTCNAGTCKCGSAVACATNSDNCII